MRISVAIDGPAGAGKSTIAKLLADRFNLMYINTGSMYRAVTLKALEKEVFPGDIKGVCTIIENLNMYFNNDRLIINGEDINDFITTPRISNNVSSYASIKEVREKLVILMQQMAKEYDVIMDGRDIGTVVLKDAPFKFFLTASSEERALRRYKELTSKGLDVVYEEILKDIIRRDDLDTNRAVDPLRKADDAIEIDTTGLGIDEVVNKIASFIKQTK